MDAPALRWRPHAEAGRAPCDKGLTDPIGELAMRSDTLRVAWAGHNVRLHLTDAKKLYRPVAGDPGLMLTAYGAEPCTAPIAACPTLASWAATTGQADKVDSDGSASSNPAPPPRRPV
ncbi:hypothetical protein [Streptomyces sp. NPDC005078]|uniref:MmyB family transcriptional regulator n=1 Tax=unclassified Streptomyces TaxID=2593676 RepID=UPI0033B92CDA